MNIKTDYDNGIEKLTDLLKKIHPSITENELFIVKSHVRGMVVNPINKAGNLIYSLTEHITKQ
jgi:hypothetical protein